MFAFLISPRFWARIIYDVTVGVMIWLVVRVVLNRVWKTA